MSRRFVAPTIVAWTLAVPASASAHARSSTVALDYRLVLDRATRTLPGISVAIIDGDRTLRVRVHRAPLLVRGDLGEPMLLLAPDGAWANRASVTAVAERLTASGHGWQRVGSGPSFTWHEHRLSPPPYGNGRPGAVARFAVPADLAGRRVALGGTFVRAAKPSLWPWIAGAAALAAAAAAVAFGWPLRRLPETLALGAVAGAAALAASVSFSTADATSGRIAWAQIAITCAFGAALGVAVLRFHGARRAHVAGVVGAAAAALTLGSLGIFRHGVVVSSLPANVARTLCVVAVTAGVAALVTSLTVEERR